MGLHLEISQIRLAGKANGRVQHLSSGNLPMAGFEVTTEEAVEEGAAPKQNYFKIPTECPHCNAKQEVHVEARKGFAQMGGPQPVVCVKCEKGFEISAPV